jgi:TolB protein
VADAIEVYTTDALTADSEAAVAADIPEPIQLAGKIAFPIYNVDRGSYDLYVASADGATVQRVLDAASQPELSPNGQQIAFRRWASDDRGIEIMNTFGGNRRRLSNFLEDALPSWSPDGQTLVFFSRREGDRRPRIYQASVGGADWEMKVGGQPIFGEYPTWSPSGQIVYRSVAPQTGIAIMNNDGAGYRLIAADGSATAPAVSPDGSTVAFMSTRDGNWDIYTIGVDGTGLTRLTFDPAEDGLPTWSPDGRLIAFASTRDGEWAIWAVRPEGGNPLKLFSLPGAPEGYVRNEADYSTRGWTEERLSWSP